MPENCNFDSTPLSQSEQIRTPSLVNINYTNQDFASLKIRLVQFIKERFEDNFNDFVEGDLGILLMEIWAFIADTLSFKQDQIVNELFIDTVTEVENAFRLCKLIGFEPTPPIAARALFSATIGAILDTDLVISSPLVIDVVANDVPTTFELFPADENNIPLFEEDIVIPSGSASNVAIVGVEGRTITEQFDGNGEANQTIAFNNSPVIFDSVRVDVDGIRWEKVDYFTDSQPRREYRVEFNSNYEAFVIFGNNRAGALPAAGSNISITYRVGGGAIGNIVTGAVNIQRPIEVPGFSFSVPVAIINYTKAEYGYDGDGIEEIRRNLPAYIRTQDRAVTGLDYKTLSEQFATSYNGQVGKATAVLRNYGCAGNVIDLFVLTQEGQNGLQTAETGLKTALADYLSNKKMFTDFVCIKDGEIIDVDIVVNANSNRFFSKFKEEIKIKLERKINDFFFLANWDFNQDLKDKDLVKSLSDIKEISSVDVSFVTADPENSGSQVAAKYYQVIRPNNITITFAFE